MQGGSLWFECGRGFPLGDALLSFTRLLVVTHKRNGAGTSSFIEGAAGFSFCYCPRTGGGGISRGDPWIPDIRSPRQLLWTQCLRSQSRERYRLVNNLAGLVAGIYRWIATPTNQKRGRSVRQP